LSLRPRSKKNDGNLPSRHLYRFEHLHTNYLRRWGNASVDSVNLSSFVPKPSKQIIEDGTNITLYVANPTKFAALISPTGLYVGKANLPSTMPIQPNEVDGTQRNVFALDGNLVLSNPNVVVASSLPLSYNASTGRVSVVQSSAKFKKDIQGIADFDTSKLFKHLEVKRYRDKRHEGGPFSYGFIAEELAPQFPDLVERDEKGEVIGVNYSAISVLTVAHIQRELALLRAEVEELKAGAK
jgi:uncharacterized small protein (DUF1192 family)